MTEIVKLCVVDIEIVRLTYYQYRNCEISVLLYTDGETGVLLVNIEIAE